MVDFPKEILTFSSNQNTATLDPTSKPDTYNFNELFSA